MIHVRVLVLKIVSLVWVMGNGSLLQCGRIRILNTVIKSKTKLIVDSVRLWLHRSEF